MRTELINVARRTYLPDCEPVEFREGEQADGDKAILGEKISKLLGVKCHWVRGQDIYG
jgi:hypothetical protein